MTDASSSRYCRTRRFRYQVFHLAGKLNLVPDALSRLTTTAVAKPEDVVLDEVWWTMSAAVMSEEQLDQFRQAYQDDARLRPILEQLQQPGNVVDKDAGRLFS